MIMEKALERGFCYRTKEAGSPAVVRVKTFWLVVRSKFTKTSQSTLNLGLLGSEQMPRSG